MGKAEEYIKANIRRLETPLATVEYRDGNQYWSYKEWLAPNAALQAVRTAREEVIERACEWLDGVIWDYLETGSISDFTTLRKVNNDKLVEDFRKAMEGGE